MKNSKWPKKKLEHWQILSILLFCYDFIAVQLAYFGALWLRFDFMFSRIDQEYLDRFVHFSPFYAVACVCFFWLLHMYDSMWRFASFNELVRTIQVSFVASLLHWALIHLCCGSMPRSYYVLGAFLQFTMLIGIRFSYRLLLYLRARRKNLDDTMDRVMLIGAGAAGQMVLRDYLSDKEIRERIVCVIDDNPNKWRRYVENVPIVGGREDILLNVEKYHIDKIIFAIPTATAAEKRDILTICKESGCELKQLPSINQLVTGQVVLSSIKDVAIDDLLGREAIQTDMHEVFDMIHGKTVLVTGGGGSIGSELCRQIAPHDPKQLIILDIYENNAYAIQLELREKYPKLNLSVLIGSVRDSRRMFQIFEDYRPEIVYHAAAHKHVPLMEDSPCEAVKNNAIGTYKTAYAAMVHGCEHFVLISTDKAVNPTNIMGASKRLCEMIVQSFDAKIKAGRAREIPQLFTHLGEEDADKDGTGRVFENIRTEFVAVRFGNVLGSNGSVIPVFKKQIEKGGPVTVTHPDIIRYFMTVQEAVSLVMLAGTYAHGGEIFVLDMGSPVKIDDLARNLIKLSGFRPDVDIKIEYTGLRPGEKLYEEKLMAEEGLRKTENKLIHIGQPIPFDADTFLSKLDALMDAAYANKSDIRERVQDIVETYHPANIERTAVSAR